MDKNIILAVVLSLAILFGYQWYAEKTAEKTIPVPVKEEAAKKPIASDEKSSVKSQSPTAPRVEEAELIKVEKTDVSTPLYEASFSSRGGTLTSFKLKHYLDKLGSDGKPIDFFNGILNGDESLALKLKNSNFSLASGASYTFNKKKISVLQGKKEILTLTHKTKDNLTVVKEFTFSSDSYQIEYNIKIINESGETFNGAPVISLSKNLKGHSSSDEEFSGLVFYNEKEMKKPDYKDLGKGFSYNGKVRWAALEEKFFVAALLPKSDLLTSISFAMDKDNQVKGDIEFKPLTIPSGKSVNIDGKIYIGPKIFELLAQLNNKLDSVIDYGWFHVVAKPLFYVLKYLNDFCKNYGLAIIILTILIKIIFHPLTHKSLKSMQELQRIQPKLKELQAKYKDDKQRLNKEMMELYKVHKVNPMGGCLPMLIQIPVFIALYKVLLVSIELRHAPFVFWVKDLSDKDPYYITPILMGITMFIQQKMTPSTGDKMQQNMMLAMPVVFTVMFLSFPSGLVIYWLVNNILSIGQQYWLNKTIKR